MSLPNRDRLTDLGKNLLITKRERWGPRGNNWLILTYAPCYLYNNPQTNCMTQGSYSTVCNKLYGKRTSNGTSLYNWIKLLYIGKENKQTQECNSPTNFNSNYTWKQNKQKSLLLSPSALTTWADVRSLEPEQPGTEAGKPCVRGSGGEYPGLRGQPSAHGPGRLRPLHQPAASRSCRGSEPTAPRVRSSLWAGRALGVPGAPISASFLRVTLRRGWFQELRCVPGIN